MARKSAISLKFLRDIFDAIGKHQRFVSLAIQKFSVNRYFNDVTDFLPIQMFCHLFRQNIIHTMYITQWVTHGNKYVTSFFIDNLVTVGYPLGYVHGVNDVLSEQVTKHLDGRKVGDIIEVPVDTKLLYGDSHTDLSILFRNIFEAIGKHQ